MAKQPVTSPRMGRASRKIGMSPGSLVHVGRRFTEDVQVDVHWFGPDGGFERQTVLEVSELESFRDRDGVLWVDVNGIHDVDIIGRIGATFGLHPLLLEDVLNANQRPKLEEHGDHLYLVLRMLLAGEHHTVEMEQVSVVLGAQYVLTFQERSRDTFDPVRRRLTEPASRVRQQGADFLTYALVDTVVDNYFAVLEGIGDRIEELEDLVVASPDRETLTDIYDVKRTLADLRRAIWPLRDALGSLSRGDSPRVMPATLPYLRDVADHAIRTLDTIETYRDTSATLIDMYMSSVSNRMNDVMRVLTVIATVFIPLTFIVGIYGMNFSHMPELEWRWGYPAVWVFMVVTVLGLVVFFRRRGWL
jgi:magnesium transporter